MHKFRAEILKTYQGNVNVAMSAVVCGDIMGVLRVKNLDFFVILSDSEGF